MNLSDHIQKWSYVCQSLESKYPNAAALLYVKGYLFGLRHAADMASRLTTTADIAGSQSTVNQPNANHDEDNICPDCGSPLKPYGSAGLDGRPGAAEAQLQGQERDLTTRQISRAKQDRNEL